MLLGNNCLHFFQMTHNYKMIEKFPDNFGE